MEQHISLNNSELGFNNISTKSKPTTVEVEKVSNAVLRRLMDEVKFESQNNILAYNRTHNRHNRGR